MVDGDIEAPSGVGCAIWDVASVFLCRKVWTGSLEGSGGGRAVVVGGYCEGSSRRGYPGLLYVHVFSAVAVLARSLNFETPVVELGPKRKIKVKIKKPALASVGRRSEGKCE